MINIVCAMHCEAKPIIDFYQLKLDREAIYPVFRNETINLCVSGIGKMEMASAISYLFARCDEVKNAAWLNVGIAGHTHHVIGSLLNINKVHDLNLDRNYYPGRIEKASGIACELVSTDKPGNGYPLDAAIDMESSAFLAIVQRYTVLDLVQILKIVSDNSEEDIEAIDKALVTKLVQNQITEIDKLVSTLQEQQGVYSAIYEKPKLLESFLSQWRFTQYQKNELNSVLAKAEALGVSVFEKDYAECKDSKAVLNLLQDKIKHMRIEF